MMLQYRNSKWPGEKHYTMILNDAMVCTLPHSSLSYLHGKSIAELIHWGIRQRRAELIKIVWNPKGIDILADKSYDLPATTG